MGLGFIPLCVPLGFPYQFTLYSTVSVHIVYCTVQYSSINAIPVAGRFVISLDVEESFPRSGY